MKHFYHLLSILLLACFCLTGCKTNQENTSQQKKEIPQKEASVSEEKPSIDITLAFGGDLSLADNYVNMEYFHSTAGEDLTACIDPAYIKLMTEADVMWINNEFCYSNQGAPMPDKYYTFRGKPENVALLKQLGVDIAGLANNHVCDFGMDAFYDTLTTLEDAGISYVGAGRTIDEASAPVYKEVQGITIAYVAATRAEKYILTPEATPTTGGVFRCYDNTAFLASIEEAAAHADFVIALPHWGTEHSTVLEQAQLTGATAYIDAGADAVIGAHTHELQGMDFYKGKPIIYSLGNFWFDEYSIDTMLLQLHLTGEKDNLSVETEVVPGTQSNFITAMATTVEEQNRIYSYIESISQDISITKATTTSKGGYVTKK